MRGFNIRSSGDMILKALQRIASEVADPWGLFEVKKKQRCPTRADGLIHEFTFLAVQEARDKCPPTNREKMYLQTRTEGNFRNIPNERSLWGEVATKINYHFLSRRFEIEYS